MHSVGPILIAALRAGNYPFTVGSVVLALVG